MRLSCLIASKCRYLYVTELITDTETKVFPLSPVTSPLMNSPPSSLPQASGLFAFRPLICFEGLFGIIGTVGFEQHANHCSKYKPTYFHISPIISQNNTKPAAFYF